jgi:hypothetical protein
MTAGLGPYHGGGEKDNGTEDGDGSLHDRFSLAKGTGRSTAAIHNAILSLAVHYVFKGTKGFCKVCKLNR